MAFEPIFRLFIFSFSIAGVFFLCWVFVALLHDKKAKRPSVSSGEEESRHASSRQPRGRTRDKR